MRRKRKEVAVDVDEMGDNGSQIVEFSPRSRISKINSPADVSESAM